MMHIAVDMDDVMLDFVGGVLAAVKKEYGVAIPTESITAWNIGPVLNPIIGRSWWDWLKDRAWLWAHFPAIDGAIGGVDRLRRDGHYMELITSKPDWAEHNVYRWLGKWRPAFQRVTIVGPKDNKADFTDASLLIDDKPANCEDFILADRRAILFTAPHNLSFDQASVKSIDGLAMPRANDWSVVVELVKRLEESYGAHW